MIDDECLDVVIMRPSGSFGWAQIGTRLTLQYAARRSPLTRRRLSRAPDLHALAYVRGRPLEGHFEAPHVVELDGDSFRHVTRVRITVRPGALRVRSVAP
ncbi:hypothetical protein [Microbacterium sp. LWH3-1.2]|uniref:hypothetical protein n=1 Tax=Microbacterium sp. LWH3-1.2 TaxID=3135256 RepID=UPI00343E4B4B